MNQIQKNRRQAMNELHELLVPGGRTKYFDSIPLTEMFDCCKNHGLVPLMEDNREWEGFLCGREGHTAIRLGSVESKEPSVYGATYTPLKTTMLVISWYKMHSGRWEVVGYLS